MPFLDSLELTPAGAQAGQLFIRDFKTRITPNDTQKITLIIAGIYVIAIAILWFVFVAFDWPHEADGLVGFLQACAILEGNL